MAANPFPTTDGRHGRLQYVLLDLLALCFLAFSSGCLATKCYIDPKFHGADYPSVNVLKEPQRVVVNVVFQLNGSEKTEVHETLHSAVIRVFNYSRVFTEVQRPGAPGTGRLDITVNNVGDIGAAVSKGFATGLTFGAVGSHVVDGYEMTATYTAPDASPHTKTYKHAIHTTIGLHSAPEGLAPVPPGKAFDIVVEDMLLNFLRDLQREGSL